MMLNVLEYLWKISFMTDALHKDKLQLLFANMNSISLIIKDNVMRSLV